MCDEDGSAKARALLDMTIAHHLRIMPIFSNAVRSSVDQCRFRIGVTHLPLVILCAASYSCGCPSKMYTQANFPPVPSQGCLKLLCRCIALYMWMAGPTGLEPAFPFGDVEQVPCAFSRDPLEDGRYPDSCAT